VTEADWEDTEKQKRADNLLPDSSPSRKRSFTGQRPHYLDFEEARQLLAEMNIHLTLASLRSHQANVPIMPICQ
jgi:hypothetical protein